MVQFGAAYFTSTTIPPNPDTDGWVSMRWHEMEPEMKIGLEHLLL